MWRHIMMLVTAALVMAAMMAAMAMPAFAKHPIPPPTGTHIPDVVLIASTHTPASPCGGPAETRVCKGQLVATVAQGGGVVPE